MGEIYPKATRYTSSAAKLSNTHDLIVSIRATLGKTNIADGIYCLGRGVVGISSEVNNVKLLSYFIKLITPELYKVSTGTTFSQISKVHLEKLKFPLPPLNEQKRIADKVERLLDKINQAKQLIEEAKALNFVERQFWTRLFVGS